MITSTKLRLDERLVADGLAATRSRARDAIVRGTVLVDGFKASKPGSKVASDQQVSVDDPALRYVSRAALKLVSGLEMSGFDPSGATALDVGASTGGFTQVLLERGARHVIAIDVGHDQLDGRLRRDKRVTVHEGLNARALSADNLDGHLVDFLVSDVSFISIKLALPPALTLAKGGARCVLLVKPQFEVGRERIGKNGIVASEDAIACADDLRQWLDDQPGWSADGIAPSPITGSDGNQEFLLWGHKA